MNYETERFLKNTAAYALATGIFILIFAGTVLLINSGNVNIESKCQTAGGQVLRTPGEVSRCLLPAR
jgi:hypothetical protein